MFIIAMGLQILTISRQFYPVRAFSVCVRAFHEMQKRLLVIDIGSLSFQSILIQEMCLIVV